MSQTLFLLYRPEPARPMLKTRSVGAESPRRGGAPRGIFSLWSETKSVGAHSICARGSLPCRKRARADMESAPTFFCSGRVPSQRRCPAWSCLPLLKAKSVGAHSICARGGLSCRKRARGCCTRKKSKCSSLFTGKCLQKHKNARHRPPNFQKADNSNRPF